MKTFLLVADKDRYGDVLDCLRRTADVKLVVIPSARDRGGRLELSLGLSCTSSPPQRRYWTSRSANLMTWRSFAQRRITRHSWHSVASLFGRRKRLYLFNFYLHELGRNRLVRLILRLVLSPSVGLCVNSPNEVDYFSALAPGTHVDHYPYSGQAIGGVSKDDVGLGDFVFAGGYSNRDYETVVAAARRLSHTEFVLVCSAANHLPGNLPSNVRVLRDTDHLVFSSLLAGSRCVIVPLKNDVGSSGQMVALGAMQFGKLTLYADFAAVSQYFIDGVTGVAYRPGDADDLCTKLVAFAEDPSVATRIGTAARESFRREFSSASVYSARIAQHALRFLSA